MPRRSVLTLLAALVLVAATLGETTSAGTEGFPVDAVGRLRVESTRLCTAFLFRSVEQRSTVPFGIPQVTYENWIATAGHCFGQRLLFQHGDAWFPVERVVAFSAGDARGYDILVATFPSPRPLPTLDPAFGVYPTVGDQLMLIGFGGRALMVRVDPLLDYDARGRMRIDGYASPGTSGGPVLIPGSRLVVGIGIASTVDRPVGAPSLHCVIARCGVKPPYIAVHIDKLKGLANLP